MSKESKPTSFEEPYFIVEQGSAEAFIVADEEITYRVPQGQQYIATVFVVEGGARYVRFQPIEKPYSFSEANSVEENI
jgi:hypothetical protein